MDTRNSNDRYRSDEYGEYGEYGDYDGYGSGRGAERGGREAEYGSGRSAGRSAGYGSSRSSGYSSDRAAGRSSYRSSERDDYRSSASNTYRSSSRSSSSRRTSGASRRTVSVDGPYESSNNASSRTGSRSGGASGAQRRSPSSRRTSYSSQREVRSVSGESPRTAGRPVYVGGQQPGVAEGILQNRVVLIAIIAVALVVLIGLVTCVSGALGGRSGEDAGAASDAAASSEAASGEASASSASDSAASAAATTGVQSPWTDDGTFTTGDAALDNYIKKVCDEHSQSGATYEQNAYDTYIYVSRCDYVERANNQSPWGEKWDVEFAKQFFEEGDSGSCYNYAAVVEYVLKYFGYSDAEGEPCVVKLQSGAWGDHGLVFVTNKADGKRCIIDPALSANGWMLGIDDYDYDVRNIGQNSTIDGNVEALLNNDVPTPIPPGELTETSSTDSADAGEEGVGADGEATYDDGTGDAGYYDETAEGNEAQEGEMNY